MIPYRPWYPPSSRKGRGVDTLPLERERLYDIVSNACDTTFAPVPGYLHEKCQEWNDQVLELILEDLKNDTKDPMKYKFVVSSTIIQHTAPVYKPACEAVLDGMNDRQKIVRRKAAEQAREKLLKDAIEAKESADVIQALRDLRRKASSRGRRAAAEETTAAEDEAAARMARATARRERAIATATDADLEVSEKPTNRGVRFDLEGDESTEKLGSGTRRAKRAPTRRGLAATDNAKEAPADEGSAKNTTIKKAAVNDAPASGEQQNLIPRISPFARGIPDPPLIVAAKKKLQEQADGAKSKGETPGEGPTSEEAAISKEALRKEAPAKEAPTKEALARAAPNKAASSKEPSPREATPKAASREEGKTSENATSSEEATTETASSKATSTSKESIATKESRLGREDRTLKEGRTGVEGHRHKEGTTSKEDHSLREGRSVKDSRSLRESRTLKDGTTDKADITRKGDSPLEESRPREESHPRREGRNPKADTTRTEVTRDKRELAAIEGDTREESRPQREGIIPKDGSASKDATSGPQGTSSKEITAGSGVPITSTRGMHEESRRRPESRAQDRKLLTVKGTPIEQGLFREKSLPREEFRPREQRETPRTESTPSPKDTRPRRGRESRPGEAEPPSEEVPARDEEERLLRPSHPFSRPIKGIPNDLTVEEVIYPDRLVPVTGRSGRHSALRGFWDYRKDGMWCCEWQGGMEKGFDVLFSIVYICLEDW